MNALRAALYARISTADQQTLPMQMAAMRNYAERRGWTVVAAIEDIGSGAKDRPKREDIMKLARRRKIDVVLVWRLDRWGRSLSDLVRSLEELTVFKVDFVSVTEGLDSTPTGKAMAGMLGVFADDAERAIMQSHTAEVAVWPAVS
jgi:putative DNA-invertase from lambdoid prophage Rac